MTMFTGAIALSIGLAACGGGDDGGKTGSGGSGSGGLAVKINTFQFNPNPAVASVGQKITWTNSDDTTHTVTAGTPDKKAGAFDGKLAGPGSTFSFTPTAAGEFPYFCAIHTSMTGTLTVR